MQVSTSNKTYYTCPTEEELIASGYKLQSRHVKKTSRTVTHGFFDQDVYKIEEHTNTYVNKDGVTYTETSDVEVFSHKKPKPQHPICTREMDCECYLDKLGGKWGKNEFIPLSPGDRFPKVIDIGHGWVWLIGDEFPRYNVKRDRSRNYTQYFTWGDSVRIRENGVVKTIIFEW